MDPKPEPPDKPLSPGDASQEASPMAERAETAEPSGQTRSYAADIKEKHRRASLEPLDAAADAMPASAAVPDPSSFSAWPSMVTPTHPKAQKTSWSSYAGVSTGQDVKEGAAKSDNARKASSESQPKESIRKTSSEWKAQALLTASDPVPPPSSLSSWPAMPISPGQGKLFPSPSTVGAGSGPSYAEASQGKHTAAPTETPVEEAAASSNVESFAEIFKEKVRKASLKSEAEAEASASPPPPLPVPPPSSALAWPSIPTSPNQGQQKVAGTSTLSGPSNPGVAGGSGAAKKMTSAAQEKKPALSWAAMASKNLPAQKKKPGQQLRVAEQPKSVDHANPTVSSTKARSATASASAYLAGNSELVEAPAKASGMASGTPGHFLPIEGVLRSTEQQQPRETSDAKLEPAVAKPAEVRDQGLSPSGKQLWTESKSAMAPKKTETEKLSPKKGSPKKTSPRKRSPKKAITWANIVKGKDAAAVGPAGSTILKKTAAPHFKPTTPVLQAATPLVAPGTSRSAGVASPVKGARFVGKKHQRSLSATKGMDDSRSETPGVHGSGAFRASPGTKQPKAAQHKSQGPGQKTKAVDVKGKGKAAASPSGKSVPGPSNAGSSPAAGNEAAVLKRHQVKERREKEAQALQENKRTLWTPWGKPPPSRQPQSSQQASSQLVYVRDPALQYGNNLVVPEYPGLNPGLNSSLNAAWPALPSQPGRTQDFSNFGQPGVHATTFNPTQHTFRPLGRMETMPTLNSPFHDGNADPARSPLRNAYQPSVHRHPSPAAHGFHQHENLSPVYQPPLQQGSPSHQTVTFPQSNYTPVQQVFPSGIPGPSYQPFQQGSYSPGPSGYEDLAIQRARDRDAILRGIPKTRANLWIYQFDWDVKIKCGPIRYRVHRHILVEQSPWFAERLPPHDPIAGYVEFNCHGHLPENLHTVLMYMYHYRIPGCIFPAYDPVDGSCIFMCVYNYICATMVDCPSLRAYTVRRLRSITVSLAPIIQTIARRPDATRLYTPLHNAMMILVDRGQDDTIFDIRLALAKVTDLVLPHLLEVEDFRYRVYPQWIGTVFGILLTDLALFRQMKLLSDPDNAQLHAKRVAMTNEMVAIREEMFPQEKAAREAWIAEQTAAAANAANAQRAGGMTAGADDEGSDDGTVVGGAAAEDDDDTTPRANRTLGESSSAGQAVGEEVSVQEAETTTGEPDLAAVQAEPDVQVAVALSSKQSEEPQLEKELQAQAAAGSTGTETQAQPGDDNTESDTQGQHDASVQGALQIPAVDNTRSDTPSSGYHSAHASHSSSGGYESAVEEQKKGKEPKTEAEEWHMSGF